MIDFTTDGILFDDPFGLPASLHEIAKNQSVVNALKRLHHFATCTRVTRGVSERRGPLTMRRVRITATQHDGHHTCVYVYIRAYTRTYTYTHVYTCIHTCQLIDKRRTHSHSHKSVGIPRVDVINPVCNDQIKVLLETLNLVRRSSGRVDWVHKRLDWKVEKTQISKVSIRYTGKDE